MLQFVNTFEVPIIQKINGLIGTFPNFDKLIFSLTYVDLFKNGILIMIYYWLWFRRDQKPDDRGKLCAAIFFSGIVVLLASTLSSVLPHAMRPILHKEYQLILPSYFDISDLNSSNTIISDHAALAFSLAVGIFFVSRPLGIFSFLWAIFAICFPRVYFGLHYISDILEGMILAIVAWMLFLQWNRVYRFISESLLRWERIHPASFYTVTFFISYELIERMDEVIRLTKTLLYI